MVSTSGQSIFARKPLSLQTGIKAKLFCGFENHFDEGSSRKISNMIGAEVCTPISPALPSPSVLPVHTATTYLGVIPIAHASLKPKLVPVFHAICCEEENSCHNPSSPGRITSSIAAKANHTDVASKELITSSGTDFFSDLSFIK